MYESKLHIFEVTTTEEEKFYLIDEDLHAALKRAENYIETNLVGYVDGIRYADHPLVEGGEEYLKKQRVK